jgi:hypothetical protein
MLVVERLAVRSSSGTVGRTRWLMRRISVAAGLLLAIVYVGADVGTAMGFGGTCSANAWRTVDVRVVLL